MVLRLSSIYSLCGSNIPFLPPYAYLYAPEHVALRRHLARRRKWLLNLSLPAAQNEAIQHHRERKELRRKTFQQCHCFDFLHVF